MKTNGVILQYFEWYYPADGSLWSKLATEASKLQEPGITAVWVPSAFKGEEGANSRGYDIYDYYDLGEFDQKGTVRTKYGTKEEYVKMVKTLHDNNIQVYADVVLNHLAGGDENEKVWVRKMNPETNTDFISEPMQIEAATRFTYPGRAGKYSDFTWNYQCFSGIGYAEDLREEGVFKILNDYGDKWEAVIGNDKPNYDFLMLSDIEYRNPAVRKQIKQWGKWYFETVGFDGVRLDALKHITPDFPVDWLDFMRRNCKPDLFAVGEYWTDKKLDMLLKYIESTKGKINMFDVPLHYNFSVASGYPYEYDLRTIFDNSLVRVQPSLAVTFVENHDTQPIQSLESNVESWFKPLAYSLILLRGEGYPCVFYGDFYGTSYKDTKGGKEYEIEMPQIKELKNLIILRNKHALGYQKDYFDAPNCIGWLREGNGHDSGCIVILSNGAKAEKKIEVGKQKNGKCYVDFLQNNNAEVVIDENGTGTFYVNEKSVSVWVLKNN